MRFYGIALLASAAILGACGGEKTARCRYAAAATTAAATTTPRPPLRRPRRRRRLRRRSGGRRGRCGSGDRQDHEVKMIGDATRL